MATFTPEGLGDAVSAALAAAGSAQTVNNSAGAANGSEAQAAAGNPYALMYRDNYGYIFGKPLGYHPRTDPNQRVFQKTLLRNNTILNIIPGIPWQDESMLSTAEEIIRGHQAAIEKLMVDQPIASQSRTKQLEKMALDTQQSLISAGCDLRYAVFKQDISGFLNAFQMVVNRVGTAVFGLSNNGLSRFVTDLAGFNVKEDSKSRGFKVWVEKGTSISESIDNSFTRSVLEDVVKNVSGVMKQAKFLGQGLGIDAAGNSNAAEITSNQQGVAQTGTMANIASRTLSGATFNFPQIFDESKFNRSYEISFKFVSPYGDDRSVMYHVILPFLFLMTCALPRQDGPSGHTSPFLLQVDAPGFFSCPMGVITNFSFRKGGDELLFNNRGLPLIIEGSMSITDLYSNLSLPLSYSQFSTNFGTSAFMNTLGGLSLYATMDASVAQRFTNWTKDGITSVIAPYNIINEETLRLQRFFGL